MAVDPDCALAHWGIAYAIGPNHNEPWEVFTPEEKAPALSRACEALKAGLALHRAKPTGPSQHPRNFWALYGLHERLNRRGESVELPHVSALLNQAMARVDVPICASCLCRTEFA